MLSFVTSSVAHSCTLLHLRFFIHIVFLLFSIFNTKCIILPLLRLSVDLLIYSPIPILVWTLTVCVWVCCMWRQRRCPQLYQLRLYWDTVSLQSPQYSLKQNQPTRNSPNPSNNQSVTADHCNTFCTNILSQQQIHLELKNAFNSSTHCDCPEVTLWARC